MHSTLFKIGPVPIRAYGLMMAIAVIVGLIRTLLAAKRAGIKREHVADSGLYGLFAGILSAHIASILLDLPYYWHYPSEILDLWRGVFSASGGLTGLSFHGGLIGAAVAVLIYTRRKGISFLAMADLFSPGLALGYGIARIGCFLNGCCYGIPTSLPWAARFQVDAVSGELTPPSHPTQLYALAASILIYVALVAVERRRRYAGQVFVNYLALYSVYRFFIEFLRKGVTAEVAFWGMTEAQVVSLIVLGVTLPLLWSRRRIRAHERASGRKAPSAKHVRD
ncbi:MAG TPA: prolipoprotein diacylglyceryl transferase [Armatimonadota bacterium]|nr:prolipoprotein diacylglyceryl transferase [Armatimonadota bacterium]